MERKRLSLKSSTKITIRKDLFGAHDSQEAVNNRTVQNSQSPLESIWGESDSFTFTQPTSNSLLLSPALKRTPNRFSTSPSTSPKNSPGTPKKNACSPRKLSKYSPFRKKVYNPNPKSSIKNFFTVKEPCHSQDKCPEVPTTSLGIEKLSNDGSSTSASGFSSGSSQMPDAKSTLSKELSQGDTCTSDINSMTLLTAKLEEIQSVAVKTPNKTSPIRSNGSTPQSVNKKLSPLSKITGSKDVYSSFLLRLLFDIIINDSDPDKIKLLNEEEYAHVNAFNQFDQPSQRLYGRLLNRKLDWIRTTTMKYGDVNLELLLLQQNGFITSNCTNENLEVLLKLLNIPELKALCKSYKLPDNGVKNDLISKLILSAKQPSIKSYFSQAPTTSSGESNLRSKVIKALGTVIKVESGPRRTFFRCLLYFSYAHYRGLERDRFSDQLALVSRLRDLTFPSYEIIRTRVFLSREHFLRYEAAHLESSELLEAIEDKQLELALQKLRVIVEKLQCYLASQDIRSEVEAMPDFLRGYTEGGCYVRAVSSSVDLFRKSEHTLAEAESALEMLLEQRLFSRHRRGQWFEQLTLLYQRNFKDNTKATNIVLRALRDEYIDVISRHTLCARAAMLEGRKKNCVKDYLKDALATQRGLVETLEEPISVTISQQVLNSTRKGFKQVYVQDSENGKMLSSVEEVAREHFRQQGYTHGGHDEGGIIKSLIFACFWNEIYGEAMADGHGLFHSEYQTVPLDWNSETFYDRRREKLKSKLQDLAEGGTEAVIACFQQCYENNINTESVVNWKYLDHFEITQSLIRSINIDVFMNLSRLLLRHHRIYRAGFPDLTLWDPIQKKCLFVEVKSPNDQLSMKQRVWLHSLNKMGANAVVCHVQSVGCKTQKRKASPTKDCESLY